MFGLALSYTQKMLLAVAASMGAITLIWTFLRIVIRHIKNGIEWIVTSKNELKELIADVRTQLGDNGGGTIQQNIQKVADSVTVSRALFDAAALPCLLFDEAGVIMLVTDGFTEATGWLKQDLQEGLWRARISADDRIAWDDVITHQRPFVGTMLVTQKVGEPRKMRARIHPIWSPDAEHRLLAYRGIFAHIYAVPDGK